MTHRLNYEFESQDEACIIYCVIEYEVDEPEWDLGEATGQIHIIDVRVLQVTGYDLDGNEVYDLLPDELSDGWAEALNLIADAFVREALDDAGCSCLGECLWENAGFCI